ncbi:MAG: plasmid stabilization protein [Methyloprofundus sp.]|nr:plasmid stabilization protein [Methyloprofundus sp.]
MASLTIRQLDADLKSSLRLRAAQNGRSMEAEARAIFAAVLVDKTESNEGIATKIQRIVQQQDAIDLLQPDRTPKPSHRKLDFSDQDYG